MATTTSVIGRDTPRVDGPLKVTRHARSTRRTCTSPGCSTPCRCGRRSPTAVSSRSTRRRPSACPACARSSTAADHRPDLPVDGGAGLRGRSARSGVRPSRTTSCATTASTSRSRWRTRSSGDGRGRRRARAVPGRAAERRPAPHGRRRSTRDRGHVRSAGARSEPARRRRRRVRERAGEARRDLRHARRRPTTRSSCTRRRRSGTGRRRSRCTTRRRAW